MTRPAGGRATVCWITDYYLPECKQRACVHSSKRLHPCMSEDEQAEKEEVDVP